VVDVVQIIGAAVAIALTYGIVRYDRTRIPSSWRQRGWNQATTGAAIYAFGPLSVVAYFWVTRRSARGVAQGLAVLLLLVILQAFVMGLVEFLVD